VRGALDVHRELLARDVPHEVVRLPSRVTSAGPSSSYGRLGMLTLRSIGAGQGSAM